MSNFKTFQSGDPMQIPAQQANAWTDAWKQLHLKRNAKDGIIENQHISSTTVQFASISETVNAIGETIVIKPSTNTTYQNDSDAIINLETVLMQHQPTYSEDEAHDLIIGVVTDTTNLADQIGLVVTKGLAWAILQDDYPVGTITDISDSKKQKQRLGGRVKVMARKTIGGVFWGLCDIGITQIVVDQFYARINAFEDDVIGRKWLYEWSQVIPDDDSIGNGWSGPVDNLTWASQYSPGVIYGKARNSIENESGIVLQRPIRVGTVVKIKVQKEVFGGTQPIMIFSATNNETSFFAEIGSYSAGLYNWTECNPDGSAITNAQTGNALNTFYGTSLLPGSPKIIPAGKIVLMEYMADQNSVGFCLSMQSPGSNDMRGDEMVTQPATLPTPYPPTDGSGVLVGQPGALISVIELDDPDNIGERIRRIYHLPPTVNDPSAQYDCVQFTTTDGGDTDGGGTGSVVNTIQNVQPDAWGHTVITEDNPEVTWTTSRNINIRGTDTNPIIEHSLQGASVGMHTVITDAATNSVNIAFTGFNEDQTGHVKHNQALDVIVNIAGDDDNIAVGLPTPNNIEITHKVPATVDATRNLTVVTGGSYNSTEQQLELDTSLVTFNSTGHQIGATAGSGILIPLPIETITCDEVWIHKDGSLISHIGPDSSSAVAFNQVSVYQDIDNGQVTLTTSPFTRDGRGHVAVGSGTPIDVVLPQIVSVQNTLDSSGNLITTITLTDSSTVISSPLSLAPAIQAWWDALTKTPCVEGTP